MIHDRNSEKVRREEQTFGNLLVGLRGADIAGRMIVRDHKA